MADHVFLCYARADEAFAHPLARRLRDQGVPVWLDAWSIAAGEDWDHAIDRAIEACLVCVVVLTPRSVQSREVRGELRAALDAGRTIVPLLAEPCSVPRQLRTVQYVDIAGRHPDDPAVTTDVLHAIAGAASRAKGVAPPPRSAIPQVDVEHIGETFARVAAGVLGLGPDDISPDTDLVASGLDDLDLVELALELERVLGLPIPEADYMDRRGRLRLRKAADWVLYLVDRHR